ncbi:MAG: chemotaxis protein CheW [candidate division Zixibacteria bacterium]|nr:chemotaxis protein CheW [candidate division Zixibacteria bacterium]
MTKTEELTIESGSAESAVVEDRAGKYLTFRLDNEEYGLEILKVREIIGLMDITSVPKTPEYVRGIINLRGSVIPVLDLKKKFDMGAIEDTEETCVIVVEVTLAENKVMMGIIVDAVSEVLEIKENEIENAPAFGTNVNTQFILGIGKVKDEVKILLDIDEVLTASDIAMMEDLAKR